MSIIEMLLQELDIDWLSADFDVEVEKQRIRATMDARELTSYDD